MARSELDGIIANLRSISGRVERCQVRFEDRPIYALHVSAEGPEDPTERARVGRDAVARYLNISVDSVAAVGHMQSDTWWIASWNPYYVHFDCHALPLEDESNRAVRLQLEEMHRICDALQHLIEAFPKWIQERYCFPSKPTSWWKILFHLATHYLGAAFLVATRRRWVNYIEGSAESLLHDLPVPGVPGTRTVPQYAWPLEGNHPPAVDIWPGMIWIELKHDILTSTKEAIEVLIGLVERAGREERVPEAKNFAEVLAEFDALSEPDAPHVDPGPAVVAAVDRPAADSTSDDDTAGADEDSGDSTMWWMQVEPVLIRVGDPFTTPPVLQWCEPLSCLDDRFIPLARWHGSAEFAVYRNMPREFEVLCEKAGELLPIETRAVATRPAGRRAWDSGRGFPDRTVPVADPVARWIRFVYSTLQERRPDMVRGHFPEVEARAEIAGWTPYGYLQLQRGFFRASAMAIRAHFQGHDFFVEAKTPSQPRGKGDSLDVAFRRLESDPEIAKQIERLPMAQCRAMKEFLVAEDALKQKNWELKVKIPAAYDWYMENMEEPPASPNHETWGRAISAARKAIPALRVNRRLKSG